ncbi:hypothetical protein SGLAD_v1c01070 [Spiroplasma gladiatoris]|uniref:DUF4064 domain-containing protein n=1 Tax=Spiroplasma gladiatoris TaxID=2143 RepID=A0A4P7AHZ2_9MOLU|nr:hypothetical protein [Spiroplasma gladiatoris]QBQ07308.1 hypothetical protein SGLAD_v1c01070 [Spiroplasma gladiatoris]
MSLKTKTCLIISTVMGSIITFIIVIFGILIIAGVVLHRTKIDESRTDLMPSQIHDIEVFNNKVTIIGICVLIFPSIPHILIIIFLVIGLKKQNDRAISAILIISIIFGIFFICLLISILLLIGGILSSIGRKEIE